MKLLRFAMLQLRTDQAIENLAAEIGGVQIELRSVKSDEEKSKAFLVIAKIPLLEFPTKDNENKLNIDNDIRQRCELGIEILANLYQFLMHVLDHYIPLTRV